MTDPISDPVNPVGRESEAHPAEPRDHVADPYHPPPNPMITSPTFIARESLAAPACSHAPEAGQEFAVDQLGAASRPHPVGRVRRAWHDLVLQLNGLAHAVTRQPAGLLKRRVGSRCANPTYTEFLPISPERGSETGRPSFT
jgi:hypothetical protein